MGFGIAFTAAADVGLEAVGAGRLKGATAGLKMGAATIGCGTGRGNGAGAAIKGLEIGAGATAGTKVGVATMGCACGMGVTGIIRDAVITWGCGAGAGLINGAGFATGAIGGFTSEKAGAKGRKTAGAVGATNEVVAAGALGVAELGTLT